MNVLLVCVILFALWRGYAGMKKGMVDEIRMLLSLVISLFVLSLAILLYSSVKEKNTTNIIMSVLMLLITGLAARLVNLTREERMQRDVRGQSPLNPRVTLSIFSR